MFSININLLLWTKFIETCFHSQLLHLISLMILQSKGFVKKIQRWDRSLPRRRMETMKRIDIALKEKSSTKVPDDVGEEGLDGHNHILNFDETNQDNDNTVESIFLHILIF